MINVILLFLLLTVIIRLGIMAVKKMTSAQALSLTKTVAYVTISASVAMLLMFVLVVLF